MDSTRDRKAASRRSNGNSNKIRIETLCREFLKLLLDRSNGNSNKIRIETFLAHLLLEPYSDQTAIPIK